jgi:serine/threonine protein kinase
MPLTPYKPKPKAVGLAAIASPRGRPSHHSAPEVEVRPTKYFPGDIIAAKYRLTRVLGEGGMGSVWLAHNLALDADVAIKLIRRELANPETSARLLTEARAAARLGHPSIVRIFDFGQTEFHEPFIVMELLKGESLGEILDRQRRLSTVQAVQTILPVASALVAAHAKGIVHRDLKPENIVIVHDESGSSRPKVVDFGIAKLTSETLDEQRKQVETVVGSPDYMSPEQARGEVDVDQRADVWAFAVVLYEMLAGRRPFEGPNYHALLTSIVEDEPPPLSDHRQVDHELWKIIRRGLEKDRRQRWGSMKAMGGALARWALSHGVEHDIGGTSIALHWLDERTRRSLAPASRRPSLSPVPETPPPLKQSGARATVGSRPRLELVQPTPERAAVETWVDPPARPRMVSPLRLVSSPPCTAHVERTTLHVPFSTKPPEDPTAAVGSSRPPLLAVHLDDEPSYDEPERPLGTSVVVPRRESPRGRAVYVGLVTVVAFALAGLIGVFALEKGPRDNAIEPPALAESPTPAVAPAPPVLVAAPPARPEPAPVPDPDAEATAEPVSASPGASPPSGAGNPTSGSPAWSAQPAGTAPSWMGGAPKPATEFPKPSDSVYDASRAGEAMPVPAKPNF